MTPLRLFVLGASGRTGRALVAQALERGHRVTAFGRAAPAPGAALERLSVVAGDVMDRAALAGALPGHDAVLSALGPSGTGPTTLTHDAASATVAAMGASGVRRLIVVGVAALFADAGLVAALLRRTFLRHVVADAAAMERVVTASALDFTIVRPPRLTNGARRGRYRVADDHLPEGAGGSASLSRADLACFLLEETERPAHLRRVVGIA